MQPRYLAFDLGAESGRVVVGHLDGRGFAYEELHRFPNQPVKVRGTLHWDILSLYRNLLEGMQIYRQRFGAEVASMGVDSWSVDFGLIGAEGSLLQNPVHYRDARTQGMVEAASALLSRDQLFRHTGMSLDHIHTVFQMLSLRLNSSPLLSVADCFLMIPDLMGYFLTGERAVERTNAIHTQLYDPQAGEWSEPVFRALDLPLNLMPRLIDPGTVLGTLSPEVAREVGLSEAPVVAPCTHDTGSAVAAIPARGDQWAFISSGTWSVLGTVTDAPQLGPAAFAANVNNELTLDRFFICRNIMGLWLLQQVRAHRAAHGESYSYEELVRLGEAAPADQPLVFPNDPRFFAPENMEQALLDYCVETHQTPPQDLGSLVRSILLSLAMSYRHGLELYSEILSKRFDTLHVVGGGSQNSLLCQLTADTTQLPVVAGPVEATVAGNLLVQALALGHVDSAQEIRERVRHASQLKIYEPRDIHFAQGKFEQYRQLLRAAGPR